MRDHFGREVSDLRISLTQRCNLRCVFCHMEGQLPATAELDAEEIERSVRAAVKVGVNRVKLTGGEPTLRPDIVEIVRRISSHVDEVSMTTNGLRLTALAADLKSAGLDRVNVSLPSPNPEVYRRLTGAPSVEQAKAGIRAAIAAGLTPLKINAVVLEGLTGTPEDMEDLADFAQDVGAGLQLIEFEPVSGRVDPRIFRTLHAELSGLTEEASARAVQRSTNWLHDRPQYTYTRRGRPFHVEVVQPVGNAAFCAACHRIRLTSYGALKGCLMTNEGLVELGPALRSGATPDELVPLFEKVIGTRRPFYTAPGAGAASEGLHALPMVRSGPPAS